MIALVNASRVQRSAHGTAVILQPTTLGFPARARVGILAAAGSGKSSLARLFAGLEPPDTGHVVTQGRVSWPMGFAGGFHPELTAADNIALLAQIVGADPAPCIAFCASFGDLTPVMNRPVKTFSPIARATLAFSFSLAVPCDTYIADEVTGAGSDLMRRKCDAMLDRRLQTAGLILLSRNPGQIRKYCQSFFALIQGRLLPCRSVDIAATALQMTRSPGPDDDLMEQLP